MSDPAVPATGPTARLELDDPATWSMIVSTAGAVLVKAVPAVAGWHIDNFYAGIVLLAVAVYNAWVMAAKHDLQGAIAVAAPAAVALAEQVATAVEPHVEPAPVPEPAPPYVPPAPEPAPATEPVAVAVPPEPAPVASPPTYTVTGPDGIFVGTLPADKMSDVIPRAGL